MAMHGDCQHTLWQLLTTLGDDHQYAMQQTRTSHKFSWPWGFGLVALALYVGVDLAY